MNKNGEPDQVLRFFRDVLYKLHVSFWRIFFFRSITDICPTRILNINKLQLLIIGIFSENPLFRWHSLSRKQGYPERSCFLFRYAKSFYNLDKP